VPFYRSIRPALLAGTALVGAANLITLLSTQDAMACVNGGPAVIASSNCLVSPSLTPTTMTFATGATGTLTLSGTSPTGAINATTAHQGNINVDGSTVLNAAATIGATTAVGDISVRPNHTLDASAVATIRANSITLGRTVSIGQATLVLGNTAVTTANGLNALGAYGGRVVVDGNATINGNIATTTPRMTVIVNDGQSLTTNSSTIGSTSSNSNSSATLITLGSTAGGADATLTLNGTTSLQTEIRGAAAGKGNLVVNGNVTMQSASFIGRADAYLNHIDVNSGFTLDTGSSIIRASTVTVGTGGGNGTLRLNNAMIYSDVDGNGNGGNVIEVTGTDARIFGNVGTTNGIDTLIHDGAILAVSDASIFRSTTTLGNGSGSNARLTLSGNISLQGSINGNAAGKGSLTIAGNTTLASGVNLGNTNSLALISVNANGALDATNAATIAASAITLNSGATLTLGNTSVTTSGGLNAGGSIAGKVIIAGNAIITGDVAATATANNAQLNVTVNNGQSLTTNSSIYAANTVLGSATGGTNAALTFNGTTNVKSKITTVENGKGNATINGNVTMAAQSSMGTSSVRLNQLTINSSHALTLSSNSSVAANTITVGSGAGNAGLILNGGTVTGNVDGDGQSGNLVTVAGSATINGTLGATNGINTVVNNGGSLMMSGANYNADTTLGNGGNGTASLTLNSTTVNSSINGNVAGQGNLTTANSVTLGATANLGNTNSLASIMLSSGTLDATAVSAMAANRIYLQQSATLRLGATTLNTGTGSGTSNGLAGDGTVAVNGNATVNGSINGNMSGGGVKLKVGNGFNLTTTGNADYAKAELGTGSTLTLQGASTWTNSTVSAATAGVGIVAIDDNITLGSKSKIGTSDKKLASVTVNAGKSLTLADSNSSIFASALTLGNGSSMTMTGGTLDAAVDGSAAGEGNLTFLGVNTLKQTVGATNRLDIITVGNGTELATLNLAQNIYANSVIVADKGILASQSDSKSITGALTVNAGSINLSTGNISVSNGVTIASGKTATMGMAFGTSASGYLDVTGGTLTLGNGSSAIDITPTMTDRAVVDGDKFLIVKNANVPVLNGGQFNVKSTALVNWSARVAVAGDAGTDIYGRTITVGHDVVIAPTVIAASTLPDVNKENAKTLDSISDTPTDTKTAEVKAALQNLGTAAEVDAAGAQLKPETGRGTIEATLSSTAQTLAVVGNRAESLRLAARAEDNRPSARSGISSGDVNENRGFWTEGFGTLAEQGRRGTSDGYKSSTAGMAVGADTQVAEALRVGLAGSYAQTWMDEKGARAANGNDITSYGAILYSSYTGEPWYFDTSLGVALHRYEGQRGIGFTGFNGIASNKHDGVQYTAKAEAGYPVFFGNTQLTPMANLTWTRLNQDGYREYGDSGANLTVASTSVDSLTSGIGGKIAHRFETSYGTLMPELRFAWLHEFKDNPSLTTARFTGGGAAFTTEGQAPARNGAAIGVGLTLLANDSYELSANVDVELRDEYVSKSGRLRLRSSF
jgi:outer membrane autotransporter protein